MKILKIIFILSFFYCINIFSQNLPTRYSQYGEMIITHLHNASFPDTGRANGYTYDSTFYSAKDHYMDSTVAVFIPKGFKSGSSINLVVHFHGWRNNADSTFAQYNLVKQFSESGKNALLVVPGGAVNVPDSYGGKLEETNGFKRFVNELMDTLYSRKAISNEKIDKIILSGHSGGYEVMAYILMRGGLTKYIKEVYIFDALYADKEKFIHWFDNYNGKLIDIYTQHGGTKRETERLIADLGGWGIPFVSFNDENNVTSFDLANNRLIFIFTDLKHDYVVYKRNEFEKYLKASCLPNIK